MTVDTSDPAAVLDAAADEILRRGLFRGGFADVLQPAETCPVCAEGAINVVETGFPWREGSRAAVGLLHREVGPVWTWSDTLGRTKEEVATAMRAAASAYRAERAS